MCVLVVDDEAMVASVAARILESHGFAVDVVHNAADALTRLTDRSRYAAVLLDYGLPDMNGVDVLAHIAQIAPGLPVVVMSGSRPTLPTGTAFVAKPFSIGRVVAAVTAAIDGPGTCVR